MAIRKALVFIGGKIKELPVADLLDAPPRTVDVTVPAPVAGDAIPLIIPHQAITILGVKAYLKGGTSVTFNVGWGTNPVTLGTNLFTANQVANTLTSVDVTWDALANSAVPANNAVELAISAVNGTVTWFKLTLIYRLT